MNNIESPPTKRMRLSGEELNRISKDEIIKLFMKQQSLLEEINGKSADSEKEAGAKRNKVNGTNRRENVLVMRLATKEQELQQYAAQIAHIKKSREDVAARSLRGALMDPTVNLMFNKMRDELKETKDKLDQAQSELSAWKFTPDSQAGKKLMSRCRTLIAENQELGKQLSQGKVAQLEAELALQKKYSEDLKESQEELNEFVIQLDEEVEGMQSTIQLLQQQLTETRKELQRYKKMMGGTDLEQKQTATEKDHCEENPEGDLFTAESNSEKFSEQNFTRPGMNGKGAIEHLDIAESSFENSELACKAKCEREEGNVATEGQVENDPPVHVDVVSSSVMDEDGSESPTISENEVLIEMQDSSPAMTPEREVQENEPGIAVSVESCDSHPPAAATVGQGVSRITDVGIGKESCDEVEHIAKIVSTRDRNDVITDNCDNVYCEDAIKPTQTSGHDLMDSENCDGIADGERHQITDRTLPPLEELPDQRDGIIENGNPDLEIAEAENSGVSREVENAAVGAEPAVENDRELQHTAAVDFYPAMVTETLNVASTPRFQELARAVYQGPHPTAPSAIKQELHALPASGPQPILPPISHSLVQPTQVPMMGDPAAAYLMNPHFQRHSATHLAQRQALMAEQAAFMYKTVLAQQQQQFVMSEDKHALTLDGAAASKPEEEIRTPVNPLLQGMPYMDQSAAFLAQYKAMLASQPIFVPGPDGKTTQMIAPGGLGLYPGLPLVQPGVMAAQPTPELVATNGPPVSWPTSTNVTYTPHSLMPQGFLCPNPAGMMLYPRHSLTPQPVTATSAAVEVDHGSVTNGLPAQNTPEPMDTNHLRDEPQIA